ncbi:hypothetical protein SESBI_25309 [Sesbania bispinosa]|nr:hypothetical protein SESBI_25309 [Sesbania bispinosa]
MTAKKGRQPSWMWASNLEGRDLLLRHGRWLVASGQQIKVGKHNWVSAGDNPYLILPGDDFPVPDLMHTNHRVWDPRKIR